MIWCRAVCAAETRCGDTRGIDQCGTDCVGRNPWFSNYSANGAAATAPCLEKLSCLALDDGAAWKAEVDVCWQQAKLSIEVTPHVRAFCATYAPVWFECGYASSVDGCERQYGMWTARVLDRLAPCANEPTCTALETCDEGVFKNL